MISGLSVILGPSSSKDETTLENPVRNDIRIFLVEKIPHRMTANPELLKSGVRRFRIVVVNDDSHFIRENLDSHGPCHLSLASLEIKITDISYDVTPYDIPDFRQQFVLDEHFKIVPTSDSQRKICPDHLDLVTETCSFRFHSEGHHVTPNMNISGRSVF